MSRPFLVFAGVLFPVILPSAASSEPLGERKPDETTAEIDRQLNARWEKEGLKPAPLVADLEFLRRAALDIVGRPPTRGEVREYLGDPRASRRSRVVDRLLGNPDYARHWADVWTDWSMSHAGVSTEQRDGMRAWFATLWPRAASVKEVAIQMLTASGSADDNPPVHFLTAHRGLRIADKDWKDLGQYDMAPLTGQVMRLFLGNDVGCAQCHYHAFDPDIRQNHFAEINLFFRQVKWEARGVGAERREWIRDDPELNKSGRMFLERRNLIGPTRPKFMGQRIDKDEKRSRRTVFADMLTRHDRFPKAMVNRVWEQLFGRNLFEQPHPETSIYSEGNDCLFPELIDRLARDFVLSNYDQRQLIRWICQSNAYQREAIDRQGTDEFLFFQRMARKPLTPRQLLAALETVLDLKAALSEPEQAQLRRGWSALAPVIEEGAIDLSSPVPVVWALNPYAYTRFLATNSDLLRKGAWRPNRGILVYGQNATTKAIVRDLFQQVYCRDPTDAELPGVGQELARARKNDPRFDAALFWEDLLMAMLNANDFTHNR